MPRSIHKLSPVFCKATDTLGRHSDGGGLYLYVRDTGKTWVLRFTLNGKRFDMGLGAFPGVSLKDARDRAADARKMVREGINPLVEAKRERDLAFEEVASRYIDSKKHEWTHPESRAQWIRSVDIECRTLRGRRVGDINTQDVLGVLTPIWNKKNKTARRVRSRIEAILDFAKAHGWREGDNPARWRGHLQNILPSSKRTAVKHHEALGYDEIPALMRRLRDIEGTIARCLEFTILTGCRSGEARLATWGEIDMDEKIWTIPAGRIKGRREAHKVPLSRQAMRLLREMESNRDVSTVIFPGRGRSGAIGHSVMLNLLRKVLGEADATVHGFRSTFRDWAGDKTNAPREVAEAALGHVTGGVEGAYRRGTALDKRRNLMQLWADWCDGNATATVLEFPAGRG